MLQLISKRNKLFFRDNEDTHFLLDNRPGVQSAPDWIKGTLGYSMGLKDRSIVDLTPPPAVPEAEPIVEKGAGKQR